MAALTICTCTLKVKDQFGANYTSAELAVEPRKSQVHSGDAVYLSKPLRAAADNTGTCTLALSETTTDNVFVIFTLTWSDGINYNTIIFDPVLIPNQSTLDLSTVLTVARG